MIRLSDQTLSGILAATLLACAGITLASVLGAIDLPEPHSALDASNHAFVSGVRDHLAHDLVKVSAIKSVVGVASSFELGIDVIVNAHVDIGQALSALGTLLTQGMETLVIAIAAFEILGLVLTVASTLSEPVLACALATSGVLALMHSMTYAGRGLAIMREAAFASLLVFALIYLAIPYAVQVSAWAAVTLAQDARELAHAGLMALHRDMSNSVITPRDVDGWSKSAKAHQTLSHILHDLPQKVSAMARVVYHTWLQLVLFAAILPAIGMALTLLVTRTVLRRLLA